MDLFSQLPEPKKEDCKKSFTSLTYNNLTNSLEVSKLSEIAVMKLISQGKEVTQTEKGIVIKY